MSHETLVGALSPRLVNYLRQSGITTFGQLAEKIHVDIMKIKGIGKEGMEEIETAMATRNLFLTPSRNCIQASDPTAEKMNAHISRIPYMHMHIVRWLEHALIRTVSQLLENRADQLMYVGGITPVDIGVIEQALARIGLSLPKKK